MKNFFLLLLLSSAVIPFMAFANTLSLTGAELLENCEVTLDLYDKNFGRVQNESEFLQGNRGGQCQGYLTSINEMQAYAKPRFCLPENIDLLHVAVIVVKYLKSHPHELCEPAARLVMNAYQQYYPCRRGF